MTAAAADTHSTPLLQSHDPTFSSSNAAVFLLNIPNFKTGDDPHNTVARKLSSKNDVLENVAMVVGAARTSGALVIHSPSVIDGTCPTYKNINIKTEGTIIPDDVLPKETDIVMSSGKTTASTMEEIGRMIKKHQIQAAFFVGFLIEDEEHLDIFGLIEMFYSFTDLRVFVLSDGTTAKSEVRHQASMKTSLPMLGINIITCSEAHGVLLGDEEAGLIHTSTPYPDQNTTDQLFDVFEFQSILRGTGIFIPSGVIVSVFVQVFASQGKRCDDPHCKLTLHEIAAFLDSSHHEVRTEAMKATISDPTSFLYFLAGSLILIDEFKPGTFYSLYFAGLGQGICYLAASVKGIFSVPLNDWRATTDSEKNMRKFKETILRKAAEYESLKVGNITSVLGGRGTRIISNEFMQLAQYIEEVIFAEHSSLLTNTDIEMLLLSELGMNYTPHTLDYTFKMASYSNSATINPIELHQFIVSNDEEMNSIMILQLRAMSVFRHTMLSLGYFLSMCFFVAAVFSVLRWSLSQCCGIKVRELSLGIKTLYDIGTLGFSYMAYKVVRDAHDVKERARNLLLSCLRYGQHYNKDMAIWKSYREKNALDASDLTTIFEASDVLLSESQTTSLIKTIDRNGDGTIGKEEFDVYLAAGTPNRPLTLFGLCFRNVYFMSQLNWFIGAIAYTFNHNTIGGVGYFLGGAAYCAFVYSNKISHLSTLVHLKRTTKRLIRMHTRRFRKIMPLASESRKTLAESVMRRTLIIGQDGSSDKADPAFRDRMTIYQSCLRTNTAVDLSLHPSTKRDEESERKLDYILMEPMSRRNLNDRMLDMSLSQSVWSNLGNLPRFSFTENEMLDFLGEDEENEKENKADITSPQALEGLLSRMISLKDNATVMSLTKLEWTSAPPVACSLLMYRLALDGGSDKRAGFLYIYPSTSEPMETKSMSAQLSTDGAKILVSFPSPHFNEGVMEFIRKIPSPEFEAVLPEEVTPISGGIGAPAVIYSEDKAQSIVHFKLDEE